MTEGIRYEGTVPDTLDLAERARIAVNGVTGALDPGRNYMPYHWAYFYANPPYMSHSGGGHIYWTGNELWGKQVETLVKMRLMSGSDQNSHMDDKTIEAMVSCLEDDGIWYAHMSRPEGEQGVPIEDHAPLLAEARVMLALLTLYKLDENPRWLDLVGKMAKGLARVAIYKDDYAYYPVSVVGGTLCMPRSGWKDTAEPAGLSMFEHGWHASSSHTEFAFGGIVRALCHYYQALGDDAALDFAGKLVNFMLKPKNWRPEAEPKAVVSADHAHFEGHVHAALWGLWGLLDYARITGNDRIKALVRDGYEYIRSFGIARIGLFAEGCTIGDMVNVAICLSDAGVGDYWEDVDQYVRNHLTEIQELSPELLQKVAQAGPEYKSQLWETSENVIDRNIGNLFADATHVTTLTPGGVFCCTENGLIAYYHAWEGIVRWRDGVAQVNLLLNRASPWLDIDSYLPFEGKVVIRNKTARQISIRIPRWVDKAAVKSAIAGKEVSPFWLNNYLIFDRVEAGDTLTIQFPVVETTELYRNGWEGVALPGHTEVTLTEGWTQPAELTTYSCRFRGNTLVDISPREKGIGYPIYLREDHGAGESPTRHVWRYVAPTII